MKKCSKRLKNAFSLLNQNESTLHTLDDSLDLFSKYFNNFSAKINENLDCVVGFSKEKGFSGNVKGFVDFPHFFGKKSNVIAFVDDNFIDRAKSFGAISYSLDLLVEDILANKIKFDKVIAMQSCMQKVSIKLSKILGPKGLMPSIKLGNVCVPENFDEIFTGALGARKSFKIDKDLTMKLSIGNSSLSSKNIVENISSLIKTIKLLRNDSLKLSINSFIINSTFGFSTKIRLDTVNKI